jgi:hypothetical protein
MAECRGLAPLARRHALVSTEARRTRPVDIPKLPNKEFALAVRLIRTDNQRVGTAYLEYEIQLIWKIRTNFLNLSCQGRR